jgi:hypothetical protein
MTMQNAEISERVFMTSQMTFAESQAYNNAECRNRPEGYYCWV